MISSSCLTLQPFYFLFYLAERDGLNSQFSLDFSEKIPYNYGISSPIKVLFIEPHGTIWYDGP